MAKAVSELKKIRHYEILDRMEAMVINGVSKPRTLAAAFNMTTAEVKSCLEEIRQDWESRLTDEELEEKRHLRVEQMNSLYVKAITGFERSCRGRVEEVHKKVDCEMCGSTGVDEVMPGEFQDCESCEGRGFNILVSEEREILPGDPRYLSLAQGLVKEMGVLEGSTSGTFGASSMRVVSRQVGGAVEGGMKELILECNDPELLLQAKTTIDLMRDKRRREAAELRQQASAERAAAAETPSVRVKSQE